MKTNVCVRRVVSNHKVLFMQNDFVLILLQYDDMQMWNNRKAFLQFLWGCGFIYRPGIPAVQSTGPCTSDGTTGAEKNIDTHKKNSNNIVHETFYIDDMRYTIMGYL
jgi:hypothetical protein